MDDDGSLTERKRQAWQARRARLGLARLGMAG
jgi:hypothetical protein